MADSTLPALSEPTERTWFTWPEEFYVEWVAGWSNHDSPLMSQRGFPSFAAAQRFRKRHHGRIYQELDIQPDPDFPKGIAYTSSEIIVVDFD